MTVPRSPYQDLPEEAFHRTAVLRPSEAALSRLYRPKFDLSVDTPIMTAGSCFAQHIHKALKRAGWSVLDGEDLTDILPDDLSKRFGYGTYSARYGNVYTSRQLLQLVEDALTKRPRPALVWEHEGRYYDALRPSVEPEGLASPLEVQIARTEHLRAVRRVIEAAEVLVFTLGQTECWVDKATNLVLPTAPGTVVGSFDPKTVRYHNLGFDEVRDDLLCLRDLLSQHGVQTNILLTVSPVPLTATASGRHIGTASAYSKAVLRAVAGDLAAHHREFDYFPAYEVITSSVAGGPYYKDNLRQPTAEGINAVMGIFAAAHHNGFAQADMAMDRTDDEDDTPRAEESVACEEILLEAFSR